MWIERILRIIVGGLAGTYVGFFCGFMGFSLGPWGVADWPESLALHIGGPFFGAIAGALGGAVKRTRLGAVVGAASLVVLLILVVLFTVVDLDQVFGVGAVLVITAALAGASGGAIGSYMAGSPRLQFTPRVLLALVVGGLAGAYVGFCCGLVGLSLKPPWSLVGGSDDFVDAAFYVGAPFFAGIAGALGGAIRRPRLGAILAAVGPVAFLIPVVLFTDVELDQVLWVGVVLVIAAALAGASGGAVGRRVASSTRFQFSLTTVFLLVLACAVACSLLAVKEQQDRSRLELHWAQRRSEWLDLLGKLQHFQRFPEWRPDGCMVGLRLVALPSNEEGDPNQELVHLKEMSFVSLDRLTIEGAAFNDTGMVRLGDVVGFRFGVDELNLNHTQVTDAGLAHLQRKSNFRSLNLSHTQISDAGIECLKGLTNLQELDLEGTQVTAAGVKDLKKALPKTDIRHSP